VDDAQKVVGDAGPLVSSQVGSGRVSSSGTRSA